MRIRRYQQNLSGAGDRDCDSRQRAMEAHQEELPEIVAAVKAATPGSFTEVDIPID
jgi:hypothetical protein